MATCTSIFIQLNEFCTCILTSCPMPVYHFKSYHNDLSTFIVTLVATSMGLLVALLIVHSMKPSINDSGFTYMTAYAIEKWGFLKSNI